MSWTEKYKGGFENGDGYEEVNFILNKKESNESKLLFEAYDAYLFALPNASSWDKKWLKEQVEFLKSRISEEFTGDVWLDDVLVIGKVIG